MLIVDDPECDAEVRPRLDLQTSGRGETVPHCTRPRDWQRAGKSVKLVPYFIKELMVDRSSASDSNAIEYFGTDSHSLRNLH